MSGQHPPRSPQDHWSVSVSRNGENVVTIETNMLTGRELDEADERTVRTAAHHLLAFVGDAVGIDPR